MALRAGHLVRLVSWLPGVTLGSLRRRPPELLVNLGQHVAELACAVGLAVLDVVRDEGLQDRARGVGERMLSGFGTLAARHRLIGDVRGAGLFLGVELVRDRSTLEPASVEASCVVNRLREEGVLLGTDGPFHNVLKVRPPMPFGREDADRLVTALDTVLAELE